MNTLGEKLLKDCNNDEIKQLSKSLGYEFSDDDCMELCVNSFDGETLSHAVNDYLDAYER
jgi:hypothetical protein